MLEEIKKKMFVGLKAALHPFEILVRLCSAPRVKIEHAHNGNLCPALLYAVRQALL